CCLRRPIWWWPAHPLKGFSTASTNLIPSATTSRRRRATSTSRRVIPGTDYMRQAVYSPRLGHSGAPPLGGEPAILKAVADGYEVRVRRPGLTLHMLRNSK